MCYIQQQGIDVDLKRGTSRLGKIPSDTSN